MLQLRYLLPRLIILGIFLLGIWVSSNTIARWAVKRYSDKNLQSTIDAKDIQVSLAEGKLNFTEFQLTPNNNSNVALLSDKVALNVSVSELLSGRLLVQNGVLENPNILYTGDSPRSSVGRTLAASLSLPSSAGFNDSNPSGWLKKIDADLVALDQNLSKYQNYSKDIQSKWGQEIVRCNQALKILQSDIVSLQKRTYENVNPLRMDQHRLDLTRKTTSVTNQIIALKRRVHSLKAIAQKDIQVLAHQEALKEVTFGKLSTKDVFTKAEMDLALYQKMPRHQVKNMAAWVDWVLDVIPSIENTAESIQGRDVKLSEKEVSSLLIKKLELRGVTDINDQYYRLLGTIENITNRGNLGTGPTTLDIRAQGKQHVMISAVFDRESGKKVISVKVPASSHTEMEIQRLAVQGNGQVDLSILPNRVFADLQVVVDGDKVTGSLTYQHTAAEMEVAAKGVDPFFGKQLSENLTMVESFQRSFRFSGSKESLKVNHSSTLGSQLALGFNEAVESYVSHQGQKRLKTALAAIRKEKSNLESLIGKQTSSVLKSVESGVQKVANLRGGMRYDSGNRQLR